MITTTLIKPQVKKKINLDDLFDGIYLLPNWEKIKDFSLSKKGLFGFKVFNVQLFRKFSSKNMVEKYSIRVDDDKVLASMDLKVYKDSVYIINLNAQTSNYYNQVIEKLLQVAVEKALYNTSNKEVRINLFGNLIEQKRMKHILENNGFSAEENQSKYEVDMFGQTYSLKVEDSIEWKNCIKQFPILINK